MFGFQALCWFFLGNLPSETAPCTLRLSLFRHSWVRAVTVHHVTNSYYRAYSIHPRKFTNTREEHQEVNFNIGFLCAMIDQLIVKAGMAAMIYLMSVYPIKRHLPKSTSNLSTTLPYCTKCTEPFGELSNL